MVDAVQLLPFWPLADETVALLDQPIHEGFRVKLWIAVWLWFLSYGIGILNRLRGL